MDWYEYGEYIVQCSRQNPLELVKYREKSSYCSLHKASLNRKLLSLYLEESIRQEEGSVSGGFSSNPDDLLRASFLLGKLMKRERLNCLVLSLYPDNEGFSLMIKGSDFEFETIKLPYEESDVLDYIDEAQIPPFLLDFLELAKVNVFYSGCIIVELRNYRHCLSGRCQTSYTLLRPSVESLQCDLNVLAAELATRNGGPISQSDLNLLESELLLATGMPLCLNSSPSVAVVTSRLLYHKNIFNTPLIQRCRLSPGAYRCPKPLLVGPVCMELMSVGAMRKHTQAALNRKRKMAQLSFPKEFSLLDFLHNKRMKPEPSSASQPLKSVDTWKATSVVPSPPLTIGEVKKAFKVIDCPPPSNDNLILVEEHRLERDPNRKHHMLAIIRIYRQNISDSFVGRLYLDHDYAGSNSFHGCACCFQLGVRQNVDRYLEQFRDLFTEEGQRLVRICIKKPGQVLQVSFTALNSALQSAASLSTTSSAICSLPDMPRSTQFAFNSLMIGSAPLPLASAESSDVFLQQTSSVSPSIAVQGDVDWSIPTPKRNVPIPLSLSITAASSSSSVSTHTPMPQAQGTEQGLLRQPCAQRVKQASFLQRVVSTPTESYTCGPLTTYQQAPGTVTYKTDHQGASQMRISIANFSGLPPGGVNLRNIPGLSTVNFSNFSLQQMQVPLSLPSIAVPISLINTSCSSLLQVPVPMHTKCQVPANILKSSTGLSGLSQPAFVTMITALPKSSCATFSSSVSGTLAFHPITMFTSVTSCQTCTGSSLSSSGLFSLPVNVNALTQIKPVGGKSPGVVGLRSTPNRPLLQLSGGHHSIQLVSFQQPPNITGSGDTKLKSCMLPVTFTLTRQTNTTAATMSIPGTGISAQVPYSTVLTRQLISTALTSLPVGKLGTTVTFPAGKLIQLTTSGTSGSSLSAVQVPLNAQLSLQRLTSSGPVSSVQGMQVQLKHGNILPATLVSSLAVASKCKGKRRGCDTSPNP